MVRCRPSCGCLVPCVRIRFVVAAASFLGFIVFLCVVLLRPPPSTVLHIRPPASRKVSVIVTPPTTNWTLLLPFCQHTANALAKEHLESEFLLVADGKKEELASVLRHLEPLKVKGHHVELVGREEGGFTHSVLTAFSKAHFSLLLLLSDLGVPVVDTVPRLVQPVVAGQTDLSLMQGTDRSVVLGLLSYPLTFSLSGGQNSSSFCIHKATWMKGCGSISLSAGSLSLELLARCHLRSHSSLPTNLHSSTTTSQWRLFTQILSLYWELHPGWCLAVIFVLFLLILFLRTVLRQSGSSPSSLHPV